MKHVESETENNFQSTSGKFSDEVENCQEYQGCPQHLQYIHLLHAVGQYKQCSL